MRRRLLSTSTRRRTLSAIVRVSWGTCGVLAVGESMLLVVLAFLDIAVAQSLEQAEELQPELPVPGDYVAWAHEGSPMDCLLTANEAGLAVYFGHMACFSQSDRALEIDIGPTTTIKGDWGGDVWSLRPEGTFRFDGLPRAVGLRHLRDFIGAIQHDEVEPPSPSETSFVASAPKCWSTSTYFARLSFWCDGRAYVPIELATSCPRCDRFSRQCSSPANGNYYQRAYGVMDVAMGVAHGAESEAPPRLPQTSIAR